MKLLNETCELNLLLMKHFFSRPALFLLCLLALGRPLAARERKNFEQAVRDAVERQMQTYPRSTLKDLYKNFFQDQFGPGHLIADTAAASRYLRHELASYTHCEGPVAEPTGWEGNFYRVNLSVIKQGRVSYDRFFDAFLRSVEGIRPVSVARWQQEWEKIEAVIRRLYPDLPDYETDRLEIERKLAAGDYVGHHSRQFETSYTPHYRIISREIYEKELKSLVSD